MRFSSVHSFIPSWSFMLNNAWWMIFYIAIAVFFVLLLKARFRLATAYSRKIFHFLIFTAAAVIQFLFAVQGTVLFGCLVSAVVVFSVLSKNKLYAALARESDAPYSDRLVLIPLVATAAGGLLANFFFPAFAFIGYLVGGWGDATGEPVGRKWGKHTYQVPSIFGIKAQRSIEGSLAVLLVSSLICLACYLLLSFAFAVAAKYALICGLAATLTEAFSSHGTDNFTIQLVVAGCSYYLLT